MTVDLDSTDFGLLELAESVMREASYEVQNDVAESQSVLLVENEDNLAVIATPVTLDRLFEVEPQVSRVLSQRLVSAPPTTKRWDAFVVLLCAQDASLAQTEPLAELVNNVRFARRLVRIGVEPTKAAVSRSLRPLLPLPAARTTGLEDPLQELHRLLVRDGLDQLLVQKGIQDFEVSLGMAGRRFDRDSAPGDGPGAEPETEIEES